MRNTLSLLPTCPIYRLSGILDKRYYQYISEHKNSENPGEGIYLIRNGQKLRYDEIKKEMEP
jgi:hypothetical protein